MLRAIVTTRILLAASLFLPSLTAFAASTATTLSLTQGGSPVTSIAAGSMITLTASVVAGSTPVTPGLVTFCDAIAPHCSDIHVLGSAQLTAAGTAVLRFTPGVGSHRYKAVFTGTNSEISSTSSSAALAVTGLDATATVSAYTGSFSNATLSATVGTIDSHGPSGTVSFVDPASTGAPLGSATLGTATAGLGFQPSATFPSIRSLGAAGDFNGDGKLDLVASTVTATGPFLTTLLGNGDG